EAESKAAESKAAEPSEAAEKKPSEEAKPAPAAADLDLAPPVSKFAPAEDLVAQVEGYVEDLEKTVESEEDYKDSAEKIAKYANTFILIALALGIHDSDNQFKAAAPAMLKAAQELAAAKDYDSAKAGVAAVKAATTSAEGDAAELKWGKLASLPELMKAVPLINTKMKRPLRSESRLQKGADDMAGYAAVLAVIAQGSLDSCGDTEKPNEVGKWQALCVEMREKAAAVNTAVRKFSKAATPEGFEATKAAVEALNKSCEACHEVFKPDVSTTTTEEE
ncbi:MAG TPA: hypothetical protein VMY37_39710, partial [Thermoguttaceae bacterium]|nr:hypothetical protein [Thermoguttaceae bacterium]